MTGTLWPAVRTLARFELRRQWRAIAAVGLAGALLSGGVLAVAAVQWRTDSAYPRLVERSGLEDVQVSLFHQFAEPAQQAAAVAATDRNLTALAARPEVRRSAVLGNFVGRLGGPGVVYVSITAPERPFAGLGVPVVVRGRAPAPNRADEVVVEEGRARLAGLRIGDRMPLDLLTTRQFLQFSTGIGRPAGGQVTLRIVGVFRHPQPARVFNSLVASPAFARLHRDVAVGRTLLLRTRGHAGAAPFAAQVARMNRAMTAHFGAGQMPYVDLAAPRSTPDPGLGPTRAVLRTGLLALAGVVLAAGLILTLQSAGRWAERGRESQQVEAVLGLRARERVAARMLAATPAVALTAAGGATGALLGGLVEPLGSLRRYEPDPGWLPNIAVAILGSLGGAVVVLGAVAVAALAVTRQGRARIRLQAPRIAAPRPRLFRLAGALAARPGGAATAMPIRSVAVALAAMLAGFVVVADTHRQLAGLSGQPERWGWTADFQVVDDTPALDSRLARDPRAQDLEHLASTSLPVRHGPRSSTLAVYGRATVRGRLPWTLAAGDVPRHAGEVALGARAAHDLAATVGDRIRIPGPEGTAVTLRVVGVVVLPTGNREPLGRNALVTREQLRRLTAAPPFSALLVRGTSAAAADALRRDLARQYELETPVPPDTVIALDELATPTRILLAVLVVAIGLLILQSIRLLLRRRSSQLAVAHTLGVPAGELRLAVVTAVLGSTLLAAGIGLPLGWAVCRVVLHEVGPRLGLAFESPAVLPPVLAGAGAAVLAAILALAAATRAVARGQRDVPRG